MHIDDIMKQVKRQPFSPFVLHLTSGRNVVVQHPDFFARSHAGRCISVFSAEGDHDLIDMTQIEASSPTPTTRPRTAGEHGLQA